MLGDDTFGEWVSWGKKIREDVQEVGGGESRRCGFDLGEVEGLHGAGDLA